MSEAETEDGAWFIYSILPPQAVAPEVGGVLPDCTVEAVAAGAFSVLASRVKRSLFDRDDPANCTADPDWMALRIAAHHAVNAAAAAAGPCLPLAFGALFSRLERLAEWLAVRELALSAALARVPAQGEWALALQQDAASHAAWLDRSDPTLQVLCDALHGVGEGAAFLMTRRLEKARRAAARAHIEATAECITARLAEAGCGVLSETPRPAGGLLASLPSWTVLAPNDPVIQGAGRLSALVGGLADELAPSGLSLRLTGPWPAYAYARAALAGEARHG